MKWTNKSVKMPSFFLFINCHDLPSRDGEGECCKIQLPDGEGVGLNSAFMVFTFLFQ